MSTFLHLYVVALSLCPSINGASLTFPLHRTKTECFYNEKLKGELIEAKFQLNEVSTKVDFALYDPKDGIVQEHKKVDHIDIALQAELNGAYAFCFSGGDVAMDTLVYFDFDMEMDEDLQKKIRMKFSKQKREFLDGVLRHVKYNEKFKNKFDMSEQFLMNIVRGSRDELNNKDNSFDNALLYLSILADRMHGFLQKHTIENRQHFNVQLWNSFNVDLFSVVIAGGMLLSACAQIIVLKSFFTGSLSWKVWQF